MIELQYIVWFLFSLLSVSYLFLKKTAGIFYVQWIIFNVFFLGVPSLFQYVNGAYPWPVYPNESDVSYAINVVLCFSIFVFVGYNIGSSSLSFYLNKYESTSHGVTNSVSVFCLLLMIPAIYFIANAGLGSFFKGRTYIGDLVYSTDFLPMLYAFSKFVAFAVLLFCLSLFVNDERSQSRNIFFTIVFLLAIFVNFLVNSPLSSPRFHFISMALALLLMFGRLRKNISLIMLGFLSPVFLYFIFPMSKTLGESNVDYLNHNILKYISEHIDFDSFQQLVNVIKFTDNTSYSFGLNFIGGVSFFIPRFLWANKPDNLGMLSASYVGYDYTNLSAPIIGEFYYAGGLIATIVGGGVMGYIGGLMDETLRGAKDNKNNLLYLISIWFVSFSFIIFRGSFGAVFPVIALGLFALFVLSHINRYTFKF